MKSAERNVNTYACRNATNNSSRLNSVEPRTLMNVAVAQVPDDALVFRDGKPFVPLVRNNHLKLTEVNLGYDDGVNVEITQGVGADDRVAINVGQAARDGAPVRPMTTEESR